MRVAHFVIITPGRCGLYETTRELVAELRKQNVDSRMFDPTKEKNTLYPEGDEDRGALFCDEEWVRGADIFVSHSGLGEFEGLKPTVQVCHGRPRHSFLSEKGGGTPIYSYHYNKNKDPNFKSIVTFWPEHIEYLRYMFPNKPVEYVPSCVDLDHWKPGETTYDFAGKKGAVNAVVTDSWRDDIDPFTPINAFGLYARENPGCKLHIYGKNQKDRGWAALVKPLQDQGTLGVYQGWAKDLRVVYRAADLVITGNEIAVRTVREATACGCPVVQFPNADISDYQEKFSTSLGMDREWVRKQSERAFNPQATGQRFKEVLNGC